jgi:hypothetical protein
VTIWRGSRATRRVRRVHVAALLSLLGSSTCEQRSILVKIELVQFELEVRPFELVCCHFQTANGLRDHVEPLFEGVAPRRSHQMRLFDLEWSQFQEKAWRFEMQMWRLFGGSPPFELDCPQNEEERALDEEEPCPFRLELTQNEIELSTFPAEERRFQPKTPHIGNP